MCEGVWDVHVRCVREWSNNSEAESTTLEHSE